MALTYLGALLTYLGTGRASRVKSAFRLSTQNCHSPIRHSGRARLPDPGRAGVSPLAPVRPPHAPLVCCMQDNFNLLRLSGDGPDWDEAFRRIPELPALSERWTVRRKAAVIQAVRGGWVPIEEIVRLYNLSVDELLAWERDVDRYGVPCLRTRRYQTYRDTEPRKR